MQCCCVTKDASLQGWARRFLTSQQNGAPKYQTNERLQGDDVLYCTACQAAMLAGWQQYSRHTMALATRFSPPHSHSQLAGSSLQISRVQCAVMPHIAVCMQEFVPDGPSAIGIAAAAA
jgi:hypothetical protein